MNHTLNSLMSRIRMRQIIRRTITGYVRRFGMSSANRNAIHQVAQKLLSLRYQEMLRSGVQLSRINDAEFRTYSQNGEDGILLYIFSVIGHGNRNAVEVCAGDGVQCNSANLIINHGWRALLFDGDRGNVRRGTTFYRKHPDVWLNPPIFVQAWITAENINSLIQDNLDSTDVDLLSLDIDGMDYWVLSRLSVVQPRVIVLEYNSAAGAERSITVPYSAAFRATVGESGFGYWGASLLAYVKLLRQRGYRLVGCERNDVNAFFIRQGVGDDAFPEIDVERCFQSRRTRHLQERWAELQDCDWLEV